MYENQISIKHQNIVDLSFQTLDLRPSTIMTTSSFCLSLMWNVKNIGAE